MGLWFDFNFSSHEGMSWMQWERLLAQRAARADALDGLCIEVHTLATMTPYDPQAGSEGRTGTQPIMHYLKHGWSGPRARMRKRWPGGVPAMMEKRKAQPYIEPAKEIARWIIFGSGASLPDEHTHNVWKSMADWIENTLFGMQVPPAEQQRQYRAGEGGAYGRRGKADAEIINPWEYVPSEGDLIKFKASRAADYRPDLFADVYASRGPGFLESMRRIGAVVRKGG